MWKKSLCSEKTAESQIDSIVLLRRQLPPANGLFCYLRLARKTVHGRRSDYLHQPAGTTCSLSFPGFRPNTMSAFHPTDVPFKPIHPEKPTSIPLFRTAITLFLPQPTPFRLPLHFSSKNSELPLYGREEKCRLLSAYFAPNFCRSSIDVHLNRLISICLPTYPPYPVLFSSRLCHFNPTTGSGSIKKLPSLLQHLTVILLQIGSVA